MNLYLYTQEEKKKKDGAINAAGSYGDKLWGRFIMEVNDPHELNWGGKRQNVK